MLSNTNSYAAGLFAEWRARMFLRFRGFRIAKSRYITGRYTGRAEIDIIAKRGNLLLFIEVKNRPDSTSGLIAISPAQSTRLRRAAETYLLRNKWDGNCRFDVIVVSGLRIKWFKNAL